MKSDSRKDPGTSVYCRAAVLVSQQECKRLYGALWKTKLVSGTVVNSEITIVKNRRRTAIIADWVISSEIRRIKTSLANFKGADSSDESQDPSNVAFPPDAEGSSSAQDVHIAAVAEGSSARTSPLQAGDVEILSHEREWEINEISMSLNGTPQRLE